MMLFSHWQLQDPEGEQSNTVTNSRCRKLQSVLKKKEKKKGCK